MTLNCGFTSCSDLHVGQQGSSGVTREQTPALVLPSALPPLKQGWSLLFLLSVCQAL